MTMTGYTRPASKTASTYRNTINPIPPPVLAGPGEMLPSGYIHLEAAQEVAATLREFGIDPDPVIREAGLDPRLFDDGANVIPFVALGRLLTLCVDRTNCPHFGLMEGQRATILSLGMVGRLMQHSETVGDALRTLVSNIGIQNRGAVPSLTISGDTALLSFAVCQPQVESADQISDCAIAISINAMRALCGADWKPTEVLLPRATLADPWPYRRLFHSPVRFNQEMAAVVFPADDLDRRIAGADPVLRAVLEERLQKPKIAQGAVLVDDIRQLLRARLTSGGCSATEIAGLLAMHRRTLSRRLKGNGIGYRALANEIRFEIARQLLENTTMSLGQVAAVLGYSEASAFTRAFRRWSGETPAVWRAMCHRA